MQNQIDWNLYCGFDAGISSTAFTAGHVAALFAAFVATPQPLAIQFKKANPGGG